MIDVPSTPSTTTGEIVGRVDMPNVGDSLYHFGLERLPPRPATRSLQRDTLIVPWFLLLAASTGLAIASTRRSPRIKEVIEGEEDLREARPPQPPHTVHCMPGDIVTISMLGDADGNSPGGFATLDARDFSIAGRWEPEALGEIEFNYDFRDQPRQNTLVSSEWGAPNTFKDGFDPGRRGRRANTAWSLHFWDLEGRRSDADARPRRGRLDPARAALAARPRLRCRASSA